MKQFIRWAGFMVLLALLVASCSRKEKNNLATVAGHGVDKDLFLHRFQFNKEFAQSAVITEQQVKNFIKDNYIDELLFLAEAYDIQMQKDSSFVAQMHEEKKRLLIRNNGPLYNKIIPQEFPVTEAELRNYYDSSGVQIQTAQILVKSGHLADSLHQLLQNGADFSELARAHSLDLRTAENGGENRRFMSRYEMVPAYDKVAFALPKQQISSPIATSAGYYIIKVLDQKPTEQKPFAEMEKSLTTKMQRYKKGRFIEKYVLGLAQKYQLSIDINQSEIITHAYKDMDRYGKVDLSLIPEPSRTQKLVTYKGGFWTVADFVRKYNEFPNNNQFPLRDQDEIRFFVNTAIIQDLMYEDALALKLDRDKVFQKELRGAEENRLKVLGRQKLLYDKIQPGDTDIANYYQSHQAEFGSQPLEAVKPMVTSRLRTEMTQKLQHRLLEELGKKFPIKYDEKLLKSVVATLNDAKKPAPEKTS